MADRMKDKAVLVCGAGSSGPGWGNGKACAIAYAREGGRVFAVDVVAEAAAETARLIAGEGFEAIAHVADVTDADDVSAMVAACREAFGRIDVLHNNVGIAGVGGPVDTTEDDWERIMRVNVTSMFLTCKHVIPVFLEHGGGAIVNVSSLSAVQALRPEAAYAASKGAVNSLTVNIAMEFADRNIRCNAILPGLIDTPMVARALGDHYGPGGVQRMIEARNALSPTGRMGTAWDLAQAALFLASDEARYVNGELLHVDAGLGHLITAGMPS
jgi:NAD(P)-dependent dehydrogenase (short-subunit alcohol dehydrogenase family)